MSVYRRPSDGVAAGDAIPFYFDGICHLFHLSSPPNTQHYPERVRCSWRHILSPDLVNWQEAPIALSPGEEKNAPDANGVWTGSVIFSQGAFHIFYTGFLKDAPHPQTICHATSPDGILFEKDERNPLLVPDADLFEPEDWRDPFVFWNERENAYWMLIASRLKEGPPNLRGCIALATSPDLAAWSNPVPFYTPYLTYCPECPELFQLGEKWYLVFSRFSESAQTIYRIADDPRGPWKAPRVDGLDGRRWYAAKSLGDGNRRISFGWVHERDGFNDEGAWEWGGDFGIPRELYPKENHELGVRCPREILSGYANRLPMEFTPFLGEWNVESEEIAPTAGDQLSYGFLRTPSRHYQFECTLQPQETRGNFGVLLNAAGDLASAHVIAFDPGAQRVSIIRWPEPLDVFWRDLTDRKVPLPDPDGPRLVERPLRIEAGRDIKCTVFVTDSIVEVFIDDEISLSYRIYETGDHGLGLFAQSARVTFKSLAMATP